METTQLKIVLKKLRKLSKNVLRELILHKVDLTGIILKPNMILPGSNSNKKITNKEIAKLTLKCLKQSVPTEIPGVAFLSGGQSEIEATKNLNLINKHNDTGINYDLFIWKSLATRCS